MKKKSKAKYKAVWTCDFCGQEFDTKKESDKHEKDCEKNPESNETIYTLKTPKYAPHFLVFFIFYFLIYLVVSSYAQNNGLSEKQFWNPLSWFVSEDKAEITLTPTPVLEPKINCSWDLKDNNGKLLCPDKLLTESECLNSTCCGLGVGKASVMSQTECAKVQADIKAKNNTQNNTNSDIVKCTFDSRCNQEPLMLKESVCKNTTCCNIALDYWVMTFTVAECKTLQDKAIALYNSIYKNSPPLVLNKYIPATTQYNNVDNSNTDQVVPTSAQPQAVVDTKKDYTSICNTQYQLDLQKAKMYGGSSVGEAIKDTANSNLSYCLQTGIVQNINIEPNIPSPTPTIVGIWYGNLGPQ